MSINDLTPEQQIAIDIFCMSHPTHDVSDLVPEWYGHHAIRALYLSESGCLGVPHRLGQSCRCLYYDPHLKRWIKSS